MSFQDGVMRFIPEYPLINTKGTAEVAIECSFIELYEPRGMNKGAYRALKQHISSALAAGLPKMQKLGEMGAQTDVNLIEDKTNKEKPKALVDLTEAEHAKQTQEMTDMILLSLEAGSEIGALDDFVKAFKKALIEYDRKPLANLNGDTPLNSGIWEAIAADDQERMAVGYCSFFGIGSLGKMLRGSGSASEQPTEVKAL